MNLKRSYYLLLTLSSVSLSAIVSPTETPTLQLKTLAWDNKSGALLYTEERKQFDFDGKPGRWEFNYQNPTGQIVVQRSVNFQQDRLKPSFILRDLRNGYSEGAETIGNKIKVFSGGSPDDPYQEKTIRVPEPAVIDAGFHFFIEQHWSALLNGETKMFYFVAPSQLDYFSFRVYKSGETQNGGRTAYQLTMDIDNFLLRLFVDPIRLTYDPESRKLIGYEGISNIYNDEGKAHHVRMEFVY